MCGKIDWQVLLGISGTVIALLALILTLWQAWVSRRHNKLSVIPYLTTWTHTNHQAYKYHVEIINNGIGPALIKSFKIFVDGHQIQGKDLELIQKCLKLLFPAYEYTSYNCYLSEGYMMAPKEKRDLVVIQFLGPTFPSPEEIEHATKRVKIFVEYESIYKDKFVYDSSVFNTLN